MLILLLCVFLCACVFLVRIVRLRGRAHPLPPACIGALPIIGHTHMFISDTKIFWQTVKTISKDCIKQGGVTYCNIGTDIYYVISDPEDALTVGNACLEKHFLYTFSKNWLGQGLINSTEKIWKPHRKLMNPAFSLPVINGYLAVFNSQSRKLLNDFDAHVEKGPFDPSIPLRNIVLGSLCSTTFGVSDVNNKECYVPYMTAVDQIFHIIMQRFQKFWLHSDFMFNLVGLKKKEDALVKTLTSISNEVIQSKKTAMARRNSADVPDLVTTHKPLLDMLLQLGQNGFLTDREIREEIDTTVVAGFHTTSHLLIIMLVLLGSHPEVQERMYDEMFQVMGKDRDVEKEDLRKLMYTEAVIKESLRLFPIAPLVLKYIDKDVKLKNYTLRGGSQCIILLFGINHQPEWGVHAEQFRPERWLDAATMPQNTNSFAGFSIGKRACIGRTYAITSMKVTLAHLIRKYLVTADHTKMQFQLDIALKPIAGHEICIQLRH